MKKTDLRLLLVDFDGVMSNGRFYATEDAGSEVFEWIGPVRVSSRHVHQMSFTRTRYRIDTGE